MINWEERRQRLIAIGERIAARIERKIKNMEDLPHREVTMDEISLEFIAQALHKPSEPMTMEQERLYQKIAQRMAERLDEREMRVINLVFFEGKTREEIGIELDLSVSAIDKIKHEAIEKLKS